MRIERVLARLSGGQRWLEPGMPSGGIPAISTDELMGALGGLPEGPTRLAYLMWGLSGADLAAAERCALVEASKIRAFHHNGIGKRPGLLRAFCRVAIAEVVSPPLCRTCRGVGYKGHKACPKCEGSGNAAMGLRDKAEIASVHYRCNKDTWKSLAKDYDYEAIYRMVDGWRSRAISHVYRQFAEPDVAAAG